MRKQATPEEIHTLRVMLKKLSAERDLYFLYFDQSEDGAPALIVDKKKIPPAVVKAMTAKAKKKRPVRGHVRYNPEVAGAEFYPIKSPGKLQKALKTFYKRVPELQKARVVLRDNAELVEERLNDAEGEVAAAEAEKLALARHEAQLKQTLALLEEQDSEARYEVLDAESALASNWRFWRKSAIEDTLEAAQVRAEKRRADLTEARAELDRLRREREAAEQTLLQAREEVGALGELWSALQAQAWEQRRSDDANWREDFQAEMTRMASVADVNVRLRAEIHQLEDTQAIRQAALRDLVEQRAQAQTASEPTEALDEQIAAAEVELVQLDEQCEEARIAAWQVRDRLIEVERSRNAVFMTDDERERAEALRVRLLDTQTTEIQTGMALDDARRAEEQAHVGLKDIEQLGHNIDSLRKQRARLLLEIDGLEGRASQWTWFRDSRREDKAAASAALAEKRSKLEETEGRMALAVEVLDQLEIEAGGSLHKAKEATQARQLAETAHAEARLDVVQCEQEIAEESATISEWHADLQRVELSRQIEGDSVARNALAERDFVQGAADRAVAQVVDAEAALSQLKARQDELVGRLSVSRHADPLLTREVVAVSDMVAEQSAEIISIRRTAERHVARAEAAEARFQETLQARAAELADSGAPELRDALGGVEAADSELAAAADKDTQAIRQREQLHDQLAELRRQGQTRKLVLDGEALVRSFREVFDALRDKDLFDSRDEAAVEAAVGPALAEIRSRLDQHAADMIQAGATSGELAAVFERVPNGLRPPAYREEVGAVDELMRRFDEIEAQNDQEQRDAFLMKTATEDSTAQKLDKLKALASAIDQRRVDAGAFVAHGAGKISTVADWLKIVGINDETDSEKIGAVTGLLWQINTSINAVGAIKGVGEALSASNPDGDPVLQKLQDKQKLEALSSLVTAGLDVGRHIAPLVALPWLGKGFVESSVKAAARTYRARTDSKLKALARIEGSPLAAALEESVSQEWRLAEKYGFSATTSAAWITSTVLALGPAAALSFAVAVTTKTASVAHEFVVSARDWKLARKANALLARARDGDPRAKTKLLQNHGRYAKGLLALKAQEGDPYALEYVASRGLEESDIRASSFDIITRYLLKESEQANADHLETFTDWASSRRAAFRRLLGVLIDPLQYLWGKLAGWLDAPTPLGDVVLPPVELPLSEASEMVGIIRDSVELRVRLAGEPGVASETQRRATLTQLDDLIGQHRDLIGQHRTLTADQLEQISVAEARFQERLVNPLTLSEDEKRTLVELRTQVLRSRRSHLRLLTTLSEVA